MPDLPPDKTLKALVDRLLLEQGRLDPLELLLAADLLAYEDYEAWRTGRRAELQPVLRVAPGEAAELLDRALLYARAQGLGAVARAHRGWGGMAASLRIGSDPDLSRACSRVLEPPPDRHQLDLFQDSTALLLEEEIRRAFAERRVDAAREGVARLMAQEPGHRHLPGYLRLIGVIDDDVARDPEERLSELESIEPLARDLLGHRQRDYLAPLWTALAEALAGRPFDPAAPRLNAAFAWSCAGHWRAATEAVEAEPGWRDHPPLVLVHAEACWRGRDTDAARSDWLWLAWEHPLEAERAFASPTLPDRRLADLWHAFGDLDRPLEAEDFPAWLLLEDPGAFGRVPLALAPQDERGSAYRLLRRLVAGGQDIALRRELGEIHPRLLDLFLAGLAPG